MLIQDDNYLVYSKKRVLFGQLFYSFTIFHSLQLLCELSLDPLTSGPIMDLLGSKKYQFYLRVH